jgi:hypothetical protein
MDLRKNLLRWRVDGTRSESFPIIDFISGVESSNTATTVSVREFS